MSIDIIIATCNRSKDLSVMLDSLSEQAFSESTRHNIIIVDNNSSDDTKEVVERYKGKFPENMLQYLFESRQGKSFALNTAIANTHGDMIVFLDDDVILKNDWLKNVETFISTIDFDAACGRVLPKYPPDSVKWMENNIDLVSGPLVSYDYGSDDKPYDNSYMNPIIGANMIAKRQLFDKLGGFNTNLGPGAGTFGDDTEISIRWEKANKRIFYAGSIAVWHPAVRERMTLKYIARWNMAFGTYKVLKDDGNLDQSIACIGGIPRYLFRRILSQSVKLVCSCFNRRNFLAHWVQLFREIGTTKTYRSVYLSKVNGT